MPFRCLVVRLFFLIAVVPIPLQARADVVLSDEREVYDFPGAISVVPDPSGSLTLDTALPLLATGVTHPEAAPNFGFTLDTIWAMVPVTNHSSRTEYLLYLDYIIDYVTLYYFPQDDPSAVRTLEGGQMVPGSRQAFRHRLTVFPVTLEKGRTYRFVIKLKDLGSMNIPVSLYTPEAFSVFDARMNLFIGVMFGVLLGLLIYILSIIISSRTTSFIFYVLFAFFHILFQLGYNGLGRFLFWPEFPLLDQWALHVGAAAVLVTGTLFAQSFLRTREKAPVFHKVFIGISIIGCSAIPIALAGEFFVSILITQNLMAVCAVLISICAIRVYRAGYHSSRFFILAYLCLSASVIVIFLKNYNLLPSTFFTTHVILFGSVVESALLSLAIADQVNALRGEHRTMQAELLRRRENEITILKEKFYQDGMTGLHNRNRLLLDLQRHKTCALFIINIDHFRQVNNLYGSLIGNQVIFEAAKRLKENTFTRPHEVYRLHADEFAVLVPEAMADAELRRTAERLHTVCQEEPFGVDVHLIPLSVTVGAAGGECNVLSRADMALAYARETGQEFMVYAPDFDMTDRIRSNLECLKLLRHSIEKDTVYPVFQPIMENRSGRIEKYETLMRLRDDEGNILLPGEFLGVAKQSKLYPQLSQSLIRKGMDFFTPHPYEFTINISVNDLLDRESMATIWRCLERHPDPKKIVFEILESESIQAYDPVARFIQDVKKRGARIAIDDFGSGYSNFEHILKLNVDFLKIDGTLVRDMHVDKNARMVVETITQFARRLNLQTVAEFVHCEDVFNLVRYLGINYSQGEYIGMPSEHLVSV